MLRPEFRDRKLSLLSQSRPMQSKGRIINIQRVFEQILDVEGDVVELGCYKGETGALLQHIMNLHGCKKELHLYDSFMGLPKISDKDRGAVAGRGAFGVPKRTVIRTFKNFDLKIPTIHAGWFQDTLPKQLPEKICFAFLDGDLYKSIKDSLVHVYPRMAPGAVALIDDYDLIRNVDRKVIFPGVKKACDEFLQDKPEEMEPPRNGQAYFKKI